MLHLRGRLVLVLPALENRPERCTWASLHEVGHYVLPDHREVLFKCPWRDLSPLTHVMAEQWGARA
jgi:hypothetical protein